MPDRSRSAAVVERFRGPPRARVTMDPVSREESPEGAEPPSDVERDARRRRPPAQARAAVPPAGRRRMPAEVAGGGVAHASRPSPEITVGAHA